MHTRTLITLCGDGGGRGGDGWSPSQTASVPFGERGA